MGRPLWFVEILKRALPARSAAARATKLPILGQLVDNWLFEGDDLTFLPGDRVARTLSIGKEIDRPAEAAVPSRIVEHFVDQATVHWVMDFCICRAAAECQDYPVDLGCLFLGEAALGINPQLGHRVTRAEALDHVRRCRDAGLVHLVGRNKLDTFWLGVGPGYQLLTVCNCCPCCCLWDVLPQLADRIGRKVGRLPGVTVAVSDRCAGCGGCTDGICFVDAIRMEGDRAVITDACRGCGRCVEACPEGAIELSVQDALFVDHAIEHISSLVDLN